MHIPDGFINLPVSLGAAATAAAGAGVALRRGSQRLRERQIPFAGLAAAFIFVLQMLNFPVAAGTTGHLIGGALAAVLLGPAMGVAVMTVVVITQALLFADGGLLALGLNVLNMAVVTVLVGWLVFRTLAWAVPKRPAVALVAVMVAAWAAVVASAVGFSLEYALGGGGGVNPSTVFAAMVGVHALIGIGEGIITGAVVGAVAVARPDLVVGFDVANIRGRAVANPGRRATVGFVAGGLIAALLLVVFVAPLAASDPDGLERVAMDTGFADAAQDSAVSGPLVGYSVAGMEDESRSLVIAGAIGVVVTFAIAVVATAVARRRRRPPEHPQPIT